MVFVIVVILRILGYPIHWTLSRHQPHQATAVDNYENGIKEDMLNVIDVKYGEIDVKNNGGRRKRRIHFSEIFTFSRMLRRCDHFPERNCVAEQFLNFY